MASHYLSHFIMLITAVIILILVILSLLVYRYFIYNKRMSEWVLVWDLSNPKPNIRALRKGKKLSDNKWKAYFPNSGEEKTIVYINRKNNFFFEDQLGLLEDKFPETSPSQTLLQG